MIDVKNDILYLWVILTIGVWFVLYCLFVKYIWKNLLQILKECWQFIKPKKRWQKIFMSIAIIIVIVIYSSSSAILVESKGFLKGIIYLIIGIILWAAISMFCVKLFQENWKILETTKIEVNEDYFIGILFMMFLIFGPVFDMILNGIQSKGSFIGISVSNMFRVCALSFFIFILIFHLIYIYLWLRYSKEMILAYRKLNKFNSSMELYSRIELLLRIVFWNTFYLFLEFIFLLVFFEIENNKLTLQCISQKFFKVISEVIGVTYASEVENLNWMIIFEGWTKIVYLVIIGVFIINYLFAQTEKNKSQI
ncbi:hypothetical protein [Caldicellulosiruptor saccharolyticus]|uniref:hypothetical protein n=1 Tax=Caldicellulosiruptor saccharolyticus TaxID=44001 RepID=UPI0005A05FCF|nr:hypothetical protein [Caldicellulosiruptor saccharolyticus]